MLKKLNSLIDGARELRRLLVFSAIVQKEEKIMTKEETLEFARLYKCPLNRVEIVSTLMRRDDSDFQTAMDEVDECVEAAAELLTEGAIIEASEVTMDYLGLEADYLDKLYGEITRKVREMK